MGKPWYQPIVEALSARASWRTRRDRLRVQDGAIDTDPMLTPPNTDWAWRPSVWQSPISVPVHDGVGRKTRLDPAVSAFHDAAGGRVSLRQQPTPDGPAAYGLVIDVTGFDGSFVSVVLDLPESATQELNSTHLVCLTANIGHQTPARMFVRLNIRHGPNTAQMVQEVTLEKTSLAVEFDLTHAEINERRIENAWIDLISDVPDTTQIRLGDVYVMRRRRAEL
ncbi:hypothetical protein So717_10000 [Roseobacter cerasinus]|uniref:Uncharacterized protein n=1 Tax=Roseobacter cerasinus TaxID=2602289 RepID=A0A640VNC6_9RHOB|nr:hypothetical protein So717_10000 [Roseobacter cerasinus]